MTDLPQAAIDAAVNVLSLDRPVTWDIIARAALEAAAPHIAAAERERILNGLRGDTFLASDGLGHEAAAVPWNSILNLLADPEGTTT